MELTDRLERQLSDPRQENGGHRGRGASSEGWAAGRPSGLQKSRRRNLWLLSLRGGCCESFPLVGR